MDKPSGSGGASIPIFRHEFNPDPEKLVEDYKAAGHMDKLKADLKSKFESEEFLGALRSQVESIVRARVQSDESLSYMPQKDALGDLQQNLSRDGVVDRFISEEFLAKMFSEEKVKANINEALQGLVAKMFPSSDAEAGANQPDPTTTSATPSDPSKPDVVQAAPGEGDSEKEPSQDKQAMEVDSKSEPNLENVGGALD